MLNQMKEQSKIKGINKRKLWKEIEQLKNKKFLYKKMFYSDFKSHMKNVMFS
jgi:hypothetical protein